MIYLFSEAGTAALRPFLQTDTLVALDYDGTLAPIVPDPARAALRPTTRALLELVAQRYPTLVLTGRARGDVLRLLPPVPALEVIGNHGMETTQGPDPALRRRVAEWKRALQLPLAAVAGVAIEDKTFSLSLHYRLATHPAYAEAAVRQAAAALPGARLVGGKCVLNVLPEHGADKGSALLAALERRGAARALYVGDDVTDEDVFALREPRRLLGVRIGRDAHSQASCFLHAQSEIDALLHRLLQPGG
jgi:trehalose 6-phosphate phosphatase